MMGEDKIKHLEFIQANIARMGQNSFQMKGWAVTIIAALLALFAASTEASCQGNVYYILTAILPTIVFWYLDSYYLKQERKFRGIYNDVAMLSKESDRIEVRPFEMPLNKYERGKYSLWGVALSKTVWPLYLLMVFGLCVFAYIAR